MTHPAADGGCPDARELWRHRYLIGVVTEKDPPAKHEAARQAWIAYVGHVAKCEECQQRLREAYEYENRIHAAGA